MLSSQPTVPVPKASAKVLIPTLEKDSDTKSASEKSSSSSPGDILGLGNYASDDDDGDDEIRSSSVLIPSQQIGIKKLSEDAHDAAENGILKVGVQEDRRSQKNMESGVGKTSSIESKNNGTTVSELNDNRVGSDLGHAYSSKAISEDSEDGIAVNGKMLDETKNSARGMETELPGESVTVKKTSPNDTQHGEITTMLDKNYRQESKKSSGKDFIKEGEGNKTRADEKGDEKRRRQDERHPRKEKADDRNGSKERMKERSIKLTEIAKQSELRKRSDRLDVKEDRKAAERSRRGSSKEDTSRKREHKRDEDEDRSRHKIESESSRHKRRRSSSISSKGRNSKDTLESHANDSSDEASDESKRFTIRISLLCLSSSSYGVLSLYIIVSCRKLQSRKHDLSPSPVRSRRRYPFVRFSLLLSRFALSLSNVKGSLNILKIIKLGYSI